MNPVVFALRRPITIMVFVVALAMGAWLALRRMDVDIFPRLDLPVIYVAQPYGGMDPAQMEGLLTNYYEYHFLYISGIHHVESRNIQGAALMKLIFHPGTDMAQAMAETISYVNRSRAFMPPGAVPPFVMRFDTGSVPVGYLVLSSESKSLAEIQDQALFKVRPMFASLPGVSAPPPFGGSARTIAVRLDPERLRAYRTTPDEVIDALARGSTISPSGNVHVGESYPMVPFDSIAPQTTDFGRIPLKLGAIPSIHLRDLGTIEDSMDLPVGYALFNGRRAIYILVTKRADASTLSVVNEVKHALPKMQEALPDDIHVSFEFDQSPYVTRAIQGLALEGSLGAALTGLMVFLFLRDWRSVIVVVLNIPLALMGSIVALWLTGETINLMTLGGLALAVGILVDEATVEVENIHTQLEHGHAIPRAVRLGNAQTAVPRLLAMLCILAVFIPSFFMQGAARGLFVPLSLAVGFSMLTSYVLSSTFVPVLSVWLLRGKEEHERELLARPSFFGRLHDRYHDRLELLVRRRIPIIIGYLALTVAGIGLIGSRLGMDVFPAVDTGQFRLRFRAPDGTHFEKTEQIALAILDAVKQKVGPQNVEATVGYVGMVTPNYPINSVYQWMRGPEEGVLRVALNPASGVRIDQLQEELRRDLPQVLPNVRFSFEPGDIVSEVMNFGASTPVEVAVNGPNIAETRAYLSKVEGELAQIPELRDLQVVQSLDYPAIKVKMDREKAGISNVSTDEVARSLVAATSSSRYIVPNFWPDPKTGIGYQVQVEVPAKSITSVEELATVPVKHFGDKQLLLRDVTQIDQGTVPGEFDRYNMKRELSLAANVAGADLGTVSRHVQKAIGRAGKLPKGATLDVRGLVPTMSQMLAGLATGLLLAIVVIFLLLSANFQSLRLAFVTISSVPAVLLGVVLALWLTRTTLNIQSFIGAIMAIGVAMANGILLVTFAHERQREGQTADQAAVAGATSRLRAILMTSLAMTAGMLPMALALGESGEQTAALGRAVVGGLLAATAANLLIMPSIFAFVERNATGRSASLDPDDEESVYYERGVTT
jgi:multidrug efflux pump subunit AcrB